jgi:hypothetical protein
MFGSGIMRALPPGTMQPPVDTAASKPACRGSRPVHVRKTCAQVPRAKGALPSGAFANPWAELARSGETAAQHSVTTCCVHKASASDSELPGQCAGAQNLADSIQASQRAVLDAAQRVQRGVQPRPPGFPPGAACLKCTQAVPLI